MSIQQIFEAIESPSFETWINLASGFRSFKTEIGNSQAILDLIREIQQKPDNRYSVLLRFRSILKDHGDPQYIHPHDCALAGYFYTLRQVDVSLAQLALQSIKGTKLWWAGKLAAEFEEHIKTVELNSQFSVLSRLDNAQNVIFKTHSLMSWEHTTNRQSQAATIINNLERIS